MWKEIEDHCIAKGWGTVLSDQYMAFRTRYLETWRKNATSDIEDFEAFVGSMALSNVLKGGMSHLLEVPKNK